MQMHPLPMLNSMASPCSKLNALCFIFLTSTIFLAFTSTTTTLAQESAGLCSPKLNAIDCCWRRNPNWFRERQQLARCSVGFAGKMTNNIGTNVTRYVVTDPSDDPVDPKPGTLRYGVTQMTGKIWISFRKDMKIKLKKALLLGSYTTVDGRGARVDIAYGACLLLDGVSNVIIHGLRIHHCRSHGPAVVMGPGGKLTSLGKMDGDAVRVLGSRKVWIDHNTLYRCEDGLVDVTLGSTDVTVSNNRFRDHDSVMLLGHDDHYGEDKSMRVTVVFNTFTDCRQRMPRVRWGFAHVVNNLYEGWKLYAIGGSMSPRIRSEANYFVASKSGNKEITSRISNTLKEMKSWKFQSVMDYFENGASFNETSECKIKPNYNKEQMFQAADARLVKSLTRSAGALNCQSGRIC